MTLLKKIVRFPQKPWRILGFLLALCFISSLAFAENEPPTNSSPEVIEKRLIEDVKEEFTKPKPVEPVQPQAQAAAPAQPNVKVSIRKITLRASGTIPPELLKTLEAEDFSEVKNLLESYKGKEVTYEDLSALSRQIEQIYRQHGYFALVYMPPQEIKEGDIILELLVSRMGEVRVEGNRYYRKARIVSRWKVKKGDLIRWDKMDASIRAMNENPDLKVQPILAAGKEPGTSDVILKVQDKFPIHGGFTLDNQGSKVTGKDRYGFMVRHNNFLTLDDIFLVGTSFGKAYGTIFLQHMLPLTSFGTRLVTGFSHAVVHPLKEFKGLDIHGVSQSYSAMIRQKLFQNERTLIDGFLGYDFKRKTSRQQGTLSAKDRLRVLSFGADSQRADTTGVWGMGQRFSFGNAPYGNSFALSSRQSEAHFFKYDFSIDRQQRLPWDLKGIFHLEAQLSPDKLPPQEQLFLGGARSVRGYPESDYGADQGVLTNIEIMRPFPFIPPDWKLPYSGMSLREQVQLVIFYDEGYGRLEDHSGTEKQKRHLMGVGGGFILRFRENLSGRFEWGVPLGEDPITESGTTQFHFRLEAKV